MEKHEKHHSCCCQGHGNSNYSAYFLIGAIVVVLVIVLVVANANNVFGIVPVNKNNMNDQCSNMMNGDMTAHMQQMHGENMENMMSGMSEEEHQSHHQ